MNELEPIVESEPHETTLFLERPPPVRPAVLTVMMVVLIGPGVGGTLVAAPIAGWLTKSWWVVGLFVLAAAAVAGLGWLIARLSMAAMRARHVNVQLTTERCVIERHDRVEQLAWTEVAALRALRQPGSGAGDVVWLDVAGLVLDLALDAAAERKAPTSAGYWSGAGGLVLRGKDGRELTVPSARVTSWGPELVRALAERRAPRPLG